MSLACPAPSVQDSEIDRVIGTDSMGADIHLSDCRPEPTEETDAEFLARLGDEEAFEKARAMATYRPLPEDLLEYAAWSEELDAGTLTGVSATRFRLGEYARYASDEEHAILTGQISSDELAMMVAHGCI
jgi:hypothetical protein